MTVPHEPAAASGTVAWCNGGLRPLAEVRVSVDVAAMRYSQVVFDGCAAFFDPTGRIMRILDLPAHLDRFRRSCAGLGLPLRYDDAELTEAVIAVARACPSRDPIGLRLFAWSDDEGFLSDRPATVCVFLRSLVGYGPQRPLRYAMAEEPRPAATDLPRWVKATAHYAGARRSVLAARAAGFDDVVFRNEHGRITESSRASLLVISGGQLIAPPVEEGVLPGITRDLVAKVGAAVCQLTGVRRPLEPAELFGADGVIACSSSLGAAVVGEVDGHDLHGDGIAAELAAEFGRAARGETSVLESVTTPVELALTETNR
jgi:branched-chain amino acid aminotransferase